MMKTFTAFSFFAVTTLSLALSNNALANKTATAGISNFTYTLVDLDTKDGIAPAIYFFNSSLDSAINTTSNLHGNITYWNDNTSVPNWQNYQISHTSPDGISTAVSGMQGGSFFVRGNLNNSDYSSFSIDQSLRSGFELSPNTKLVVRGNLFGSAVNVSPYPYNGNNYARSITSISLINQNGNNSVDANGSAAIHSYGDNSQYYSNDFSLSYYNSSRGVSLGQIYIHNYTIASDTGYVMHNVASVPEPEIYAMMLMGLVGMASLARRKKNTSEQKIS